MEQGINHAAITNLDLVDAALCAYTAHLAAKPTLVPVGGRAAVRTSGGAYSPLFQGAPVVAFGEEATGLIIVPQWSASAAAWSASAGRYQASKKWGIGGQK